MKGYKMRKFVSFLLASLLVVGLYANVFADAPASENAVILGPFMGSVGITPATEVVKVRYSYEPSIPGTANTNIVSGDILVWDSTSGDGYTVSICTTSWDTEQFAGVAVQGILTADNSNVDDTQNIGYMAVRGYCLARVFPDSATNGDGLMPISVAAAGATSAFITSGSVIHLSDIGTNTEQYRISNDVGTCLKEPSSTGLGAVYLR